jgi:hypothetical protein
MCAAIASMPRPPPEILTTTWLAPGRIAARTLNPDPKNLAAQYAILNDRERPYYEHRFAA